MERNRDIVLKWIGLSEGGYVNNPKDPGGPTNRGITQRTYDAWNKLEGQPKRSVRVITKAEADRIVFEQYMVPVRFDELFPGLDYAVADYSVNSGPAQAAKALQRLLGVTADGIIGARTIAALPRLYTERARLLDAYADSRMTFLRGLKTWTTFGKGWTTRVEGKKAGSQSDDIGVRDRAVWLLTQSHTSAPVPAPEPQPVGPGKGNPGDASTVRGFWATLWAILFPSKPRSI